MIESIQFGAVLIALLFALFIDDRKTFTAGVAMLLGLMVVIDPGENLTGVLLLCLVHSSMAVLFVVFCGRVHGTIQGILVSFHLLINLMLCIDVRFGLDLVYAHYMILSELITLIQCIALVVGGGACAIYGYFNNIGNISAASSAN